MSKFTQLCKKYFKKTDLYDILGVSNDATEQQVRKAYHKLSLKVHPDRVSEEEKGEATEKFKILSRIYSILSNPDKRKIYDDTNCVDDEDNDDPDFDWLNFWRAIFKPLSHKDYEDYEVKYKNSEEEKADLKKAYVNGEGNMDFILEAVPFTNCEDEPRLKTIVQGLIDDGQVPVFDCFFNEPPAKALRRKRKYEKEARLAEQIASPADKDTSGEEALRQMIAARQKDRENAMSSFYDNLAAKYGGGEKRKKSPAIKSGDVPKTRSGGATKKQKKK